MLSPAIDTKTAMNPSIKRIYAVSTWFFLCHLVKDRKHRANARMRAILMPNHRTASRSVRLPIFRNANRHNIRIRSVWIAKTGNSDRVANSNAHHHLFQIIHFAIFAHRHSLRLKSHYQRFACQRRRVFHEELDCTIEFIEIFNDNTYEYDEIIVNLVTIKCKLIDGIPKAKEHAKLIWLPIDYIESLNWAPADCPTVKKLLSK